MNDETAVRYGVLKYSSINIGDEIQSLAASRFLPHIDYYIHRERVDAFRKDPDDKTTSPVKLIMNGWWMWEPNHFPPSDAIDPLFVAFHWTYENRNRKSFTQKTINYLRAHAPIGCRDTSTVTFLREQGIDAFFTGCLTSTLTPNLKLKGQIIRDYILCVDTPDTVLEEVRKRSKYPVYSVSRDLIPTFDTAGRFKLAKYVLFLYHNARCVISPCLHAAMPSLAFGTPVLLLCDDKPENTTRFEGLAPLFHNMRIDGKDLHRFDINNPPPNPDTFTEMRNGLIERCRAFTGYDRAAPIFEDSYQPMADLMTSLNFSQNTAEKTHFFSKHRNFKTFMKDYLSGKTKYDIGI